MDCSVTTRWTKPSNRFLKPAINEPKLPPKVYWSLRWSNSQHSVDSDTALWAMELASGHRHWGGLFRSSAAHAPSVCGQPHGRWLPRCSPLGSYQCNRCAFALRTNAGVERGTDAPAFPRLGGLGGLRCFPRNHQSGFTRQCRILLRSGASAPKAPAVSLSKRIVILGGGFAGMHAAECLEEKLRRDSSISLTLVNETNALLFTPMLAEVAGSSLEPSHISTPLRSTLRRAEFIRGLVEAVDLQKRLVILRNEASADRLRGTLFPTTTWFSRLGPFQGYRVFLESAI